MQTEVLDLGLVIVKEAIENPKVILEKIESLDKKRIDSGLESIWSPWQDSGREPFCHQFRLSGPEDIQRNYPFYEDEIDIYNSINHSADTALEEYFKLYPYARPNLKGRERPNILKYTSGGLLPAHQDHGVSSRALSVLLYLNDDYEGGEISFPQSKVTLKPPAGSVIFFPSNFIYVHEIAEMKSGVRYAVPAWFHNRKDMYMSDGSE
jgi:hypothetical protein